MAFPGLGQECGWNLFRKLANQLVMGCCFSFLFFFTILVCCSCSFRNYRCVYVTVWSKSNVPKRQCPKVPENRMWPQEGWYLVNKWRGPSLNFQNKGLLILFCFVFVFTLSNTISGHVSLLLKDKGSGFEAEKFHFWVESLVSSGLTQTICTI